MDDNERFNHTMSELVRWQEIEAQFWQLRDAFGPSFETETYHALLRLGERIAWEKMWVEHAMKALVQAQAVEVK